MIFRIEFHKIERRLFQACRRSLRFHHVSYNRKNVSRSDREQIRQRRLFRRFVRNFSDRKVTEDIEEIVDLLYARHFGKGLIRVARDIEFVPRNVERFRSEQGVERRVAVALYVSCKRVIFRIKLHEIERRLFQACRRSLRFHYVSCDAENVSRSDREQIRQRRLFRRFVRNFSDRKVTEDIEEIVDLLYARHFGKGLIRVARDIEFIPDRVDHDGAKQFVKRGVLRIERGETFAYGVGFEYVFRNEEQTALHAVFKFLYISLYGDRIDIERVGNKRKRFLFVDIPIVALFRHFGKQRDHVSDADAIHKPDHVIEFVGNTVFRSKFGDQLFHFDAKKSVHRFLDLFSVLRPGFAVFRQGRGGRDQIADLVSVERRSEHVVQDIVDGGRLFIYRIIYIGYQVAAIEVVDKL